MKAVLLDASTLGDDIDLSPIRDVVTQLVVYASTAPEQLVEHLSDADLIITNKVVIPSSVMSGRKAILVLATGTNNIDMEAARQRAIPVFNVNNYGTESVAQHTWMLILALAGQLARYQFAVETGHWQRSSTFCLMQHSTLQLTGKQLVLVGSGHLGQAVARLANAFGMRVQFTARPGDRDDARPSLDSLLPQADVLSFHCPLTTQTRGILDAERLRQIKTGCLVVNCARGGIIDEVACLEALRAKRLGGLAVDVLPEEPPRQSHPLLSALAEDLNLIVTPHNAWISREARQAVVNLTAHSIRTIHSHPQQW